MSRVLIYIARPAERGKVAGGYRRVVIIKYNESFNYYERTPDYQESFFVIDEKMLVTIKFDYFGVVC
ncbi:MAG: hypothetical protein PUB21_10565 [Bacteroidales bacterium]|nr:hypothetical protein [Bacteroidales bacterium]